MSYITAAAAAALHLSSPFCGGVTDRDRKAQNLEAESGANKNAAPSFLRSFLPQREDLPSLRERSGMPSLGFRVARAREARVIADSRPSPTFGWLARSLARRFIVNLSSKG